MVTPESQQALVGSSSESHHTPAEISREPAGPGWQLYLVKTYLTAPQWWVVCLFWTRINNDVQVAEVATCPALSRRVR